jgi:acyl-[acyl-carrier-protein]-phospholipid O-acyltransferase/long-chain-fatty-acid--[acyl-carrier-protein] ligase
MPRQIPYRVTVSFGKPMPSHATAIAVRAAVQELQADAFEQRKPRMKTLDRAFVQTARRHPLRFFAAEAKTAKVSFGSALTKTMFIARRLRGQIGDRTMVGLLLPPSVGGALTNYALMLRGAVRSRRGHRLEGVSATLSEYGDSGPDFVAGGCAG